jgi:hypothetical protein
MARTSRIRIRISVPGGEFLLSGVILGLDPRISISMHNAELSRVPGATDARVKPEHDVEAAISTPCEGLS